MPGNDVQASKTIAMLSNFTKHHLCPPVLLRWVALFLLSGVISLNANAATKTAISAGNWSNAAIWSPSGVPASTDDVVIGLSANGTVTIDGNYTCNNFYLGTTSNHNMTVSIVTATNSLTINGDLQFNPSDKNSTYILDAGPGNINISGTASYLSTKGHVTLQVGTGHISITPAYTTTANTQIVKFTAAGTIDFHDNFTQAHHECLATYTNCTVNFYKSYIISSSSDKCDWNKLGVANFNGTSNVHAGAALNMNDINLVSGASFSLDTVAGNAVAINGNFTLSSSSTFNMNESFELDGNLTNNSGTFSGASYAVLSLNGLTSVIGGTSSITLPGLSIGLAHGAQNTKAMAFTINTNVTVASLSFTQQKQNSTLTINGVYTLSITGNLAMYQPNASSRTALLSIGGGTCTVSGNLIFSGSSNTLTEIAQIAVTNGTFTLAGTITWLSNTAVATEIISVTTGTLNFSNSVTMGGGSGTIKVTSSGNINFNGTSAPSLGFGGSGTAPVLTTAYGSTVVFAKGLTATTSPLTFATGANTIIAGTATITPTAAISFANLQINSGVTATLAGNIYVKGNWVNNGTFVPAAHTITLNGFGTQTITNSTGTETFYNLTTATSGMIAQLNSNVIIADSLTMSGANINVNGYTLTLGNNAGAILNRSAGQIYGGTFKRWFPVGAITSTSGAYYGLFPIGSSTQYRPITVNSTANPTTAGYVTALHNDALIGGTATSYTDNEGSNIQAIANQYSDMCTSGLAGGTYTITVKFTQIGSSGNLANLKLETHTGGVMGSCGTTVATIGTLGTPVVSRKGLSVSNLCNSWVVGTNDATTTPLYLMLYSRKTGNWNDSTATGTWSRTPGGSGAACSCHPNSSAYTTIYSGHTVTLAASDSALYVDILSGGALSIGLAKTFNVGANMETFGTGTFTNNGTLNVNGELGISPTTSPTVTGNVKVLGWFTVDSGAAYTQTTNTLEVSGDLIVNGKLAISTFGNLTFDGAGSDLSGTGSITTASGGIFSITNSKVIDLGTSLTIGTSSTKTAIYLATNTAINNLGSITVYGSIRGADPNASIWTNNSYSYLGVSDTLLATGVLDVADAPNTVDYTSSGAQTITVPVSSYNIVQAINGGTKTLGGASIVVDSSLILGSSTLLNESTNAISGQGNLVMSGTSELRMSRSVEAAYPELDGNYFCTGGTVTITQTSDSDEIQSGPYYNLKLNGSAPSDISAISSITNNLYVQSSSSITNSSPLTIADSLSYSSSAASALGDSLTAYGIWLTGGTLIDGGYSININGAGGFIINGGTFTTSPGGAVYFTSSGAQTLSSNTSTQVLNDLCTNKSSGTVTVAGSLATLTLNGDMTLMSGTFDKGTATTINMSGGNWVNNGGSFTPGTGTVIFNDTATQYINGSATSNTFNNLTINNSQADVIIGGSLNTLQINGNVTLTSGILDAGTDTAIYMTAGNWVNNGGSFFSGNSDLIFNGSVAQAINGTAVAQTLNSLTVNKSANTISVGGSTANVTLNGNMSITAGTFNVGTDTTLNVAGNWIMNAGTFTNTGSTVVFNGSNPQSVSSTGTFNNLTMNSPLSYVNLTGNITVNGKLTFTNGTIHTNSNSVILGSAATTTGASTASYIYGNEQINFPNASAPSKTFNIGDATTYAPVLVAFSGTTSGSGSLTAYTTAGNASAISTSGINSLKTAARTWTLTNNGIGGFTSYSPTFNFVAGDVESGANTANFITRIYNGSSWVTTTSGTRTSTSTQATGVTAFGISQMGEANALTVTTNPANITACAGTATSISSTSTSTPAPTIVWQRDPNTGVFATITSGTDGGIYTNYNTSTLNISSVTGLNNYKYKAVFTNINGTVSSTADTFTINAYPTISGTTPGSRCGTGSVTLAATSATGTINWYAASSGGSSLYTGAGYSTASIASTTTYYVDATSGSCTTASRTAVTATVNTIPTINSVTGTYVCGSGIDTVYATASAGTINWYAAPSGGSSLNTGGTYITPSISTTTVYYVDATSSGCTTATRTSVSASVKSNPGISISYHSCPGVDGNTTIKIAASGGTSPYTYSPDGINFNSYDTVHMANTSVSKYYVADKFGCKSPGLNDTIKTTTPTRIAATGDSAYCGCVSAGEGRDLYLSNGTDLIAIINDAGHNLGTVTAKVYTRSSPVIITNNQGGPQAAMARSFLLHFTGTNLTPNVQVKFPFTNKELSDLKTAAANTPTRVDDINSVADLGDTQYEGPNEDNVYNTSGATMLIYHTQLASGTLLDGQYITIGMTANGEDWLNGSSNGSALPVQLVSFNAVPQNKAVQTNWITDLEINNDYFTVERSADGIDFTEAGKVEGHGNSTETNSYNFTDINPLSGVSYYRLKQTDFNGNYTYSKMVAVDMQHSQTDAAPVIYPNPANDQVFVRIPATSNITGLKIFDVNGSEVYTKELDGLKANIDQLITIPVGSLARGIYMITSYSETETHTEKLVVQ